MKLSALMEIVNCCSLLFFTRSASYRRDETGVNRGQAMQGSCAPNCLEEDDAASMTLFTRPEFCLVGGVLDPAVA